MDFKDKFIRYHTDITFEIFQLIWDKLHSSGWKHMMDQTIENSFKLFSQGYIISQSSFLNEFNFYLNPDKRYTEITVEEFLGCNPFNKLTNQSVESNKEYPEYYEFIGNNSSFTKGKIYKIKNPTNLEAKHNFIDDRGVKNGWGGVIGCNHKYFKPSTKEAFDLQEEAKQNEIKAINEFKKNEYIVFTEGLGSSNFPLNYIFKQKENKDYLSVYQDTSGQENGWEWHRNFYKSYLPNGQTEPIITDWRYATKEEIAEYDRLGKPYDVTTLNKPKFEVRKWYSFDWNIISNINKQIICKIKEVKSDSIIISWRKYLYDNSTKNYGGYYIEKISNIKELSLDEIQQYLPDGHPDKITKENHEFKVGDWVYFMGTDPCLVTPHWTIGKIDQIKKIVGSSLEFDTGSNRKDQFRLATSEEIKSVQSVQSSEFILPKKWCVYIKDSNLVSDKYKCSKYSKNYYVYSEPVNSKEFNYIIGSGKLEEYTEITFDQFKHYVLKEEKIMENNFKVGDYVEIIANTSYSSNKVGDIGIITEIGTADDCRVKCNSITTGNWSYLKELKLSSLEAYNKKYGISNSKDDLLEEAKRRYPIGTNFISPHNNLPYKVHSKHELWYGRTKDNILISISKNIGDYVYFNGKWAEIIEEPDNESNYKIDDCPFNEGDLVSCEIYNKYIEGKIHFEDNRIYICQNVRDGMSCKDKLGYKYSCCIYSEESNCYKTFLEGCKWNSITNLKLLNKSKSSDSLDDEHNEIFSGKGIINQIKSKPTTYSESFTSKNLEKVISDIKVSTTLKKTETSKIELLKTTKI